MSAGMDTVEIVGFLGGAFGLSVAGPQALRIRRLGNFGVSRGTWMLTYGSFCNWIGYGIKESSPSQAVTNGIGMLLGAWLLWALLDGERWRLPFIVGVAIAGPLIIILVPPAVMTIILLGFSMARWPQVFRSWNAWRAKTPIPAVSNLTWLLSLTSAMLWLLYGALDGRNLVIATSTLAMVASTLVLAFTRLAGRSPEPGSPIAAN